VEDLAVFFLEDGCLELIISNGLSFNIVSLSFSVDGVGMCDDHVQPDVWFHLLDEMRVLQSRYALDGVLLVCEGLEELYNTFADTGLLSPLMNVYGFWVEEKDLGVCELLFLWLFALRLKSWIDGEDRANG
jgi:hypothetical protein